jgi:Zn-dependent peptidase ImmA (M78 family)
VSPPPFHSGERAAREARIELGLGKTEPIGELLDVVEGKLGVPILIDRFDADEIAGVLLRRGGEAFVALNADHHPVRQRFTLAHEIGHLRLDHRPRVDLSADLFGGQSRDPQEIEANYFAAEFLAPRSGVVDWLDARDLRRNVDARAVVRLAFEFGVSFPTACYRLERAGVIGPQAKRRLLEETRGAGKALARQFEHLRLRDTLETFRRAGSYPRAPRQTAEYASRARDEGLIDDETYNAMVPAAASQDITAWFE